MVTAAVPQNRETIPAELPTEPVDKWLRRRLFDGLSPEVAAEEALLPVKRSGYYAFFRPGMLSLARSIHRQIGLRLERTALSPTVDEVVWRQAVKRLTEWTFRDGQGNNVVWKESTREQHLSRVLWIEVQERALAEDKIRHQCAIELFDEHNVECLGEIEDWEERWRKKVLSRGVDPNFNVASGAETAQAPEALAT